MGKKSYLLFPTTVLVNQSIERMISFGKRAGFDVTLNNPDGGVNIAYYHSDLKKREKEHFLNF